MRLKLFALALVAAFTAAPFDAQAQRVVSRKETPKEAELGRKEETKVPERDLAGDVTRRKKEKEKERPALEYDQYRLGVELQVASKRREQIDTLRKIIDLGPRPEEAPDLRFRLAELYWEESKFYFFESGRKDDDILRAKAEKNESRLQQAEAERAAAIKGRDDFQDLAIEQYRAIVTSFPDYKRMDEVLFFLGHNMWDGGKEREAVTVYQKLIKDHAQSKYLPDAWVAVGQYYFNNSKGKPDDLEKALDAFKKAASFTDSKVYGYALYMQGWCQFNLGDFKSAMDLYKAVIYYGELQGKADNRSTALSKEARKDYVVAFSRVGDVLVAKQDFQKVGGDENWWGMLKGLANLYFEDGKDAEAYTVYGQLIKERPLSPEAPFFQGRIVDCVMRKGIKKITVDKVRDLVRIIKDVEKAGVVKKDEDKKSFQEAQDLAERTLSNLAVNWHNEAKKTRDENTFFLAAEVYQDYLEVFPENPKAYDLRFFYAELLNDNLGKFDRAAEEYTKVLLADAKKIDQPSNPPEKPGRWLVNAAYNAILAYDEVAKRFEKDEKLPPSDGKTKLAIPAPKKNLLDACLRYLKYVPDGEKRVDVAYKAGYIYYRYNHFDKSTEIFADIALQNPESELAETAANLVLDSFNIQGDWAKVNEWARKFFAEPRLAKGKLREDLGKVLEQSSFKLVNIAEEKGDFEGAAEAYLSFVNEFSQSDLADLALLNASVDYFKAGMLDRSIEVRSLLVERYPKSKHVPKAIYANGEAYEAIADFEQAAAAYEAYTDGFARQRGGKAAAKPAKGKRSEPKAPEEEGAFEEAKAQAAIFNAGTFREYLGQYREALRDRTLYLDLWPDSKESEKIFLSIADLHAKAGAGSKAVAQFDAYEKKYRDPDKVLAARLKVAKLQEKAGNARAAQKIYQDAYALYEKMPKGQREKLGKEALDVVARGAYLAVEPDFARYAKLSFPKDQKKTKSALEAKQKALLEVRKRYGEVVALNAAEPGICSLYKIGLLFKNLADTLNEAPIPDMPFPPALNPLKPVWGKPWAKWPKEYKEAVPEAQYEELQRQLEDAKVQFEQAYRDGLSPFIVQADQSASEALETAVAKSRELKVYNECADQSLDLLADKYKPDLYPKVTEELAPIGEAPEVREGGGLLQSVQPIPVAPKRAAKKGLEDPPPDLSKVGAGREPDDGPAPAARPSRQVRDPEPRGSEPDDPDLLK